MAAGSAARSRNDHSTSDEALAPAVTSNIRARALPSARMLPGRRRTDCAGPPYALGLLQRLFAAIREGRQQQLAIRRRRLEAFRECCWRRDDQCASLPLHQSLAGEAAEDERY